MRRRRGWRWRGWGWRGSRPGCAGARRRSRRCRLARGFLLSIEHRRRSLADHRRDRRHHRPTLDPFTQVLPGHDRRRCCSSDPGGARCGGEFGRHRIGLSMLGRPHRHGRRGERHDDDVGDTGRDPRSHDPVPGGDIPIIGDDHGQTPRCFTRRSRGPADHVVEHGDQRPRVTGRSPVERVGDPGTGGPARRVADQQRPTFVTRHCTRGDRPAIAELDRRRAGSSVTRGGDDTRFDACRGDVDAERLCHPADRIGRKRGEATGSVLGDNQSLLGPSSHRGGRCSG